MDHERILYFVRVPDGPKPLVHRAYEDAPSLIANCCGEVFDINEVQFVDPGPPWCSEPFPKAPSIAPAGLFGAQGEIA